MVDVTIYFPLEWTLHVLVSDQSLTVLFLTLLFNLVGRGGGGGRGRISGSSCYSYGKVWVNFYFSFVYLIYIYFISTDLSHD